MIKVLLVYPRYPDTFWSFRNALKFVKKKASHPPLGLLTIASLLPKDFRLKVLDLNTSPLNLEFFKWADWVLISAMSVQRESAEEVIKIAKSLGKTVIAGGPLFTAFYQDFIEKVDHLVLNEGEITLPKFLEDWEKGCPQKVYYTSEFVDLKFSPVPSYHLIKLKDYTSMCIQYSRGCPFSCEFCDVTNLFGRKIRTKTVDQIIAELENLYKLGWRGSVFFVDDNFIGKKPTVKQELLPSLIRWQEKHRYPFVFYTQASINLADDDELIELLVKAGFNSVFIGIETPVEESLAEVQKRQNLNRNLIEDVKKIQRKGLEVMGGFIVGFDSDPPNVFNSLVKFIEESKIVIAMVGLLNAPPGTNLYQRLKTEGRIRPLFKGNNTDLSTNIIPKMGFETLLQGYKKVITNLYETKRYYKRVFGFLKDFNPYTHVKIDKAYVKNHPFYLLNLPKIIFKFGVLEKGRILFWKMFFYTFFKKPKVFATFIAQVLGGYHFRKVFRPFFLSGKI